MTKEQAEFCISIKNQVVSWKTEKDIPASVKVSVIKELGYEEYKNCIKSLENDVNDGSIRYLRDTYYNIRIREKWPQFAFPQPIGPLTNQSLEMQALANGDTNACANCYELGVDLRDDTCIACGGNERTSPNPLYKRL